MLAPLRLSELALPGCIDGSATILWEKEVDRLVASQYG